MNWKEFLKIDFKKIISVVVLLFIVSGIFGGYCIYIPGGVRPWEMYGLCYIAYLNELTYLFPPFGFIIYVFCLYFISCSMFWIFDKVKKK